MKKSSMRPKRKGIKAKLIFVLCLVVVAAGLIATLLILDNANGDPAVSQGTQSGGKPGINLPIIDVPLS